MDISACIVRPEQHRCSLGIVEQHHTAARSRKTTRHRRKILTPVLRQFDEHNGDRNQSKFKRSAFQRWSHRTRQAERAGFIVLPLRDTFPYFDIAIQMRPCPHPQALLVAPGERCGTQQSVGDAFLCDMSLEFGVSLQRLTLSGTYAS